MPSPVTQQTGCPAPPTGCRRHVLTKAGQALATQWVWEPKYIPTMRKMRTAARRLLEEWLPEQPWVVAVIALPQKLHRAYGPEGAPPQDTVERIFACFLALQRLAVAEVRLRAVFTTTKLVADYEGGRMGYDGRNYQLPSYAAVTTRDDRCTPLCSGNRWHCLRGGRATQILGVFSSLERTY